jgi:pimeloyl-ACP methyl ester carboxylesterase
VAKYYQSDGRATTPAQEQAVVNAARTFVQECLTQLPPPDRLQFYGTRQAVEDLEAFRKHIGDDKLWLYGESYGTQFAQWYAAAHPDRVAALVLDGVVDLTLTGPQFLRDQTQAFNDVLVATLEACNADKRCRKDVGRDAIKAYDQLAQKLDRAPVEFDFPLPNGAFTKRAFGYSDLETAAVSFLYAEGDRMIFQRAIASAAHEDYAPLARLFYNALGLDPRTLAAIPDPSYSDAVFYTVECNDYDYFDGAPDERAEKYLRFGDRVDEKVARLNAVFYGDMPCAFWPRDAAAPKYEIGFATLIPTLVLGATADPATPVNQGRAVFERLNNTYLITARGGPHVIFGRGETCPDEIVTGFLVDDRMPDKPETRCKGVIATDYAPIAPADAREFKNALDALISAEREIYYAPEYYYWDMANENAIGCAKGGSVAFEATDGEESATRFTLTDCAFSTGFVMTGAGRYNPDNDRWSFKVDVSGYQTGRLEYVRDGDAYRVTGMWDGRPVDLRR